jgi:hypothetical protein
MDREQKEIENHLEKAFERSFEMHPSKAINYIGKNIKEVEELGYNVKGYKGLYFLMFEDIIGYKILN